ncbi:MAG: zinc-dependent alcohol dehydrogenase family protein [Burkholderiales bacterium]
MKAVLYYEFGGPISIETVPDPRPEPDGAVIRVEATGLCRSDWHGWRGHDADIRRFPHIPGHEFAGSIVAVGSEVHRAAVGQRITMPFVSGCGTCSECLSGNQQVCDHQFQPGFTGWGSYAEFVAVRYVDGNVVPLPQDMASVTAAALGCRLGTAYRAVVAQGATRSGEWVAVHGCGGVGLSVVLVARALGARVIAVDVRPEPLEFAKRLGAEFALNACDNSDVPAAIHDLTHGGVYVSIDALGGGTTFANSVLSLRKRGRHVQVGLLTQKDQMPSALISRLIAWELAIIGSHGIQAHAYPGLFALIQSGKLDPTQLVERTMSLDHAPRELESLDGYPGCGVTVFTPGS